MIDLFINWWLSAPFFATFITFFLLIAAYCLVHAMVLGTMLIIFGEFKCQKWADKRKHGPGYRSSRGIFKEEK